MMLFFQIAKTQFMGERSTLEVKEDLSELIFRGNCQRLEGLQASKMKRTDAVVSAIGTCGIDHGELRFRASLLYQDEQIHGWR